MNNFSFAFFLSIALHIVFILIFNFENKKKEYPLLRIEVSESTPAKKNNEIEAKPEKLNNSKAPNPSAATDIKKRNDIISKLNTKLQNQMTYPPAAVKLGYEGTVTIQAIIRNQIAQNIKVIDSSGHQILDDQVVETVKLWDFSSNMNGSIALTFEFSLN